MMEQATFTALADPLSPVFPMEKDHLHPSLSTFDCDKFCGFFSTSVQVRLIAFTGKDVCR